MAPRINLPPLTRALLVIELCLSLIVGAIRYRAWLIATSQDATSTPPTGTISYAHSSIQYLTIVPALSIFYPWTFITSSFVEQNIFTLLVTSTTFFYGGKYLERAWGSREFAYFIGVCAFIPNCIAFAVYVIWFGTTGDVDKGFTSICGGFAFQAGFLVAFKQLVPEHTVTLFKGLVKMRVKHFPALLLLSQIVSGVVLGTDVAATLSILGFLTSWTFLRFYKTTSANADLSTSNSPSLRGDASETFALAHFFPEAIQPPIRIVSDVVYNILLAVRVCTPFSEADVEAGNIRAATSGASNDLFGGGGGSSGGNSGGRISAARAEAERRRALALKALDQRLHAATNSGRGPTVGSTGGGEMLGGTSFAQDGDEGKKGLP